MELLGQIWSFLSIIVVVSGGAVWLRSSLARQRTTELESLADTRGKRIDDLETQVLDMKGALARLEAKVEALHELKTEEIANRVVEKIRFFQEEV